MTNGETQKLGRSQISRCLAVGVARMAALLRSPTTADRRFWAKNEGADSLRPPYLHSSLRI